MSGPGNVIVMGLMHHSSFAAVNVHGLHADFAAQLTRYLHGDFCEVICKMLLSEVSQPTHH